MQEALLDTYGYQMSSTKAAAQQVVSSTAFVSDTDLALQLQAGWHQIQAYIPITVAAAGNILYTLVADQGLTVNTINIQGTLSLTGVLPQIDYTTALAQSKSGGGTNAWTSLVLFGNIFVQGAGVLQFRFAQATSNASPTIIQAGASMQSFGILNA